MSTKYLHTNICSSFFIIDNTENQAKYPSLSDCINKTDTARKYNIIPQSKQTSCQAKKRQQKLTFILLSEKGQSTKGK
jgi:hypothetical protein